MSFLHRFSIFQRLLALGGLALVGLLGVTAIGVLAQESIFQSSRQVINVHKRIEFLGEKSLAALLNVRRYEKDLLLNMGDPQKQEEYRKKWLEALAESHQLYAAMAATSPEYAEFQGRLDLSLKEYESAARKVLDTAIQGGYLSPGEANDSITVVAKVVIHRMETDIKAAASKAEVGATAAWTEAESQARTARLAMITLSLLAGGVTLAGVTILAIGTARSLKQGVTVASAIAEGRLDNEIVAVGSDETATLLRALRSMQEHLHDRNARDHEAASEMTRIKIALDSVSIPVRIADPAGRVIYANLAMLQTLHRLEPALQAQNPAFRSEGFVGSSIGAMYADPDAGLRRLAALTKTVDIIMDIGGRTYRVVTSPVFDAQGERLGSVGEWQDRTDQLLVETEISAIVGNASAGHLDRRIDPAGKDGFFLTLAQGINGLLDATQQALLATSAVLSRVAQGDLTQTIDADYAGIFGQLKDDTNGTITRLREVVSRIQETADAINTGSKEIAAGNQNLSGRTEEQAGSLEETASSMEELTAMVKQNAENARTANELARQSNEIANRGGALVKGVVATMGEIQDSSRKIEDIIGVVDSIAFQTNILALNAAVEAARAGEQGRGFAVVASEVRSLAQRSATAAREIKALIAESVGKVEGGARLVEQAGSTIDEVVVSFQRVAGLVTDISAASREQSTGIEQVTRAVSQMDEITQQNAALVEQAAAAAEGLQEQAQGLVRAVGRFKLAGGDVAVKAPSAHPRTPRAALQPAKKLPMPRQASAESAWEEF